jgi:hypothetical protein
MRKLFTLFLSIAAFASILFAPLSLESSVRPANNCPEFADRAAELRHYLAQAGLDADWIRVAKLEAGAQLNSHVSKMCNNYFGMHMPGRGRPTTATENWHFYAKYPSAEAAVIDLRYWAAMRPRRADESFDQWLKHRGWNHLPTYFRTLAQVAV